MVPLFLLITAVVVLFYLMWVLSLSYHFELSFRDQNHVYRNASTYIFLLYSLIAVGTQRPYRRPAKVGRHLECNKDWGAAK
jgi:hypothetical protein